MLAADFAYITFSAFLCALKIVLDWRSVLLLVLVRLHLDRSDVILLIDFISLPEFNREEYSAAKVDSISQFSKPIAVFP